MNFKQISINILLVISILFSILTISSCVTGGKKTYKTDRLSQIRNKHSFNILYNKAIKQYKKNDIDATLNTIKQALDIGYFPKTNIAKNKLIKLHNIKFNILKNKNKKILAISSFIDLYKQTFIDKNLKTQLFITINNNINKLQIKELEDLLNEHEKNTVWGPEILFEIANKNLVEGKSNKARNKFQDFLEDYPEHPYRKKSLLYVKQLKNISQTSPFTIGVALPLSGKYARYGIKSLNGIQLAYNMFSSQYNRSNLPIKLAIIDTSKGIEHSKNAVLSLISKDKVIAIIGGLRTTISKEIAQICQNMSIPNLSLTQDSQVPNIGQYIFSTAMNLENQIRVLVKNSIKKLAIKKFAIFYPEDNYGKKAMNLFWDEVKKNNAKVVAVEKYALNLADYREPIKKLLSIFYLTPRHSEYILEKKSITEAKGRPVLSSEVKLPPIVDFDALFIPDDANTVSKIAPYLSFFNAKGITLIGLNTWHNKIFLERGEHYVDGAMLVDGFHKNGYSTQTRSFTKDFKKIFSRDPSIFEAQAYDTSKILLNAISKLYRNSIGDISRRNIKNYLTNLKEYKGTTGKMKFLPNGSTDKELFTISVKRKRFHIHSEKY